MNRRDLFHIAAGSVALAAFQDNAIEKARAASQSVNGRKPEEIARDEDYWAEIRDAFTIDRNVINLNNGHVSPAPRPVQDALRRYIEFSDMGPWHTMIDNLEKQIEMVRRRLAVTAGCDAEEMAITRNASESLEIAQCGIDLKPGDEVLTTNQDYGRMLTTFRQRERREGIVLKTISFPVPPPKRGRSLPALRACRHAEDQAHPGLPHHQSHGSDFSDQANLRNGARPQHSGYRRWRPRV